MYSTKIRKKYRMLCLMLLVFILAIALGALIVGKPPVPDKLDPNYFDAVKMKTHPSL